jgi:uracil-DNA glycosylase
MLSTIDSSWNLLFEDYRIDLDLIYEDKKQIFPINKKDVLKIFKMNVDNIKIVFLGQDCYHGPNQAMGLSFSVPKNCHKPSSLQNIYKNLMKFSHINIEPTHGDLSFWAYQGVLLLNSALTVEKSKANSCQVIWTDFTNELVSILSSKYSGIFFSDGFSRKTVFFP